MFAAMIFIHKIKVLNSTWPSQRTYGTPKQMRPTNGYTLWYFGAPVPNPGGIDKQRPTDVSTNSMSVKSQRDLGSFTERIKKPLILGGCFLSHRGTPSQIIHFTWDVPWKKPTIYWIAQFMETPIDVKEWFGRDLLGIQWDIVGYNHHGEWLGLKLG